MALKGQLSRTFLNLGFLALDISLFSYLIFPSAQGRVGGHSLREEGASDLVRSAVITSGRLIGVHVGDDVAFPVVQQPEGNSNYVSSRDNEVTQFAAASAQGNLGLLAHNYLSGRAFSQFQIGEEIRLIYDNGQSEYFIIDEILRYQALEPRNPYSTFKNLDDENEILSAGEMFDRAYAGDYHITFQTCIKASNNPSWGRLFILASPRLEDVGMGQRSWRSESH